MPVRAAARCQERGWHGTGATFAGVHVTGRPWVPTRVGTALGARPQCHGVRVPCHGIVLDAGGARHTRESLGMHVGCEAMGWVAMRGVHVSFWGAFALL